MYGPSLATFRSSYGSDQSQELMSLGYGCGIVPTENGPLSVGNGRGGTFFACVAVFPALDAAFAAARTTGADARATSNVLGKVTRLDWEQPGRHDPSLP